MPKYEITDNETGKVYEIDGARPPSQDEVMELLGTVRTTKRRDMLQSMTAEMAYDPYQDERYTPTQRLGRKMLQPIALGLKGLGAYGQRTESMAATPMLEIQKAAKEGRQLGPLELARAAGRGMTTKPTNELGDVAREAGTPEPLAQAAGLAGSALLPGVGSLSNAGSRVATMLRQSAGRGLAKAGRWTASAQLRHLAQRPPEAVENFLAKSGNMLKAGAKPEEVATELSNSIGKVKQAAKSYQRKVSDSFGEVLEKNKDTSIDVQIMDEAGTNSLTRNVRQVMSGSSVSNLEGDVAGRGASQLQSIIDDIEKKTSERGLTVDDIRFWKKQLNPIARNESLGSVYAAANALEDDLVNAVNIASPELRKASKSYRAMKLLLYGSDNPGAGGTVGVYNLIQGGKASGVTKAHDFFALTPQARKSLSRLEATSDPQDQFLGRLKDRATALEMAPTEPVKGTSLLGQVTVAQKPHMIPALVAVITGASPKLSSSLYKGIMTGRSSKILRSPAMKTLQDTIEQFGIGPGLARTPRLMPYADTEE